ncbi:MAG: YdcF family protein [Cyanobacteria bacterium J06648_16]
MEKLQWRWLKYGLISLSTAIVVMGLVLGIGLSLAARSPADAYLVLGGSIRREMYMAEQVGGQSAEAVPLVLISSGSQDPCIRLLFEQAAVPLDAVWLEKCARSTFGNYMFSLPVLKQWRTQHVRLVTSGSHTRRAVWMARIILGAHRIWVTPDIVEEVGIPGNEESGLKTTLDIARSLLWAVASQVYSPDCDAVVPLTTVDLTQWRQQGFKCEHQAGIEGS